MNLEATKKPLGLCALGAVAALTLLARTAPVETDGQSAFAEATPPPAAPVVARQAHPVRAGAGAESATLERGSWAPGAVAAFAAALDAPAPYVSDELLVRAADGAALEALAASVGGEVVRGAGRSGFAALRVAPETADAARAQLSADPRVSSVAPMGRIAGATSTNPCDARWRVSPAHPAQWHLDHVKAARPGTTDLSGVTVAVLDTGVAYETWSDADGTYTPVASLASGSFVAAYDFVNGDAHANDDHQHGTHITSIIASDGDVEGVAPGVSIMPLKVLDEDNVGTELMLIEALYHAADNGADVINMALAFPEGYTPSMALREALAYAADSGAVLVGAAGNEGVTSVAYPAAAPQVIAVGASRLDAADVSVAADYTNIGPKIDVMAPGGDLGRDENGDGIADGIVAETIVQGDPSQSGLYLLAGTSQASAMVSGAAAWLVAGGADADEVRAQLQNRAKDRSYAFSAGTGAGEVDVKRAVTGVCTDRLEDYDPGAYAVGVLPRLTQDGADLVPTASLSLVDGDGQAVRGQTIYVNLTGSTTGILSCRTDQDGVCSVEGDPIDTASEGDAHAWAFRAEAVVRHDISHQPGGVLFHSESMEAVLAELGNRDDLTDAVVAFYDDGSDADAAEAYTFIDMGTGLASSPLGVIATPSLIEAIASTNPLPEDDAAIDGTGLASSPLGLLAPVVLTVSVDGSGLASSPLGLVFGDFDPTVDDLDGTGLASSPLGFVGDVDVIVFSNELSFASDADLSGAGLASSPLGFTGPGLLDPTLADNGEALQMGSATGPALALDGTATGAWLDGGGFVTGAGYPLASLLITAQLVEVPAAAASLMPTGQGSQAL